ncbi:MAG TPA: diacylglycerol kinase family protein [Bryobacteraceae bacterium]
MIYNPRAGKLGRNGHGPLERAVEILKRDGHQLTLVPTTGPQTAGPLAREHVRQGADLVLAAGGDGTINEIGEGLIGSEVPIGILPAGTANVLATEMKLGSRLERAAARLGRSQPCRIPVGHVSCQGGAVSRHFLLMAGIGLDAHIVYRVSAPLKSATGKFAYWVAGWSLLGRRLAEFAVEMNGVRRTCSFALVSKVRNYGGDFEIARDVSLFDDHFEVVLFEGRSTLPYVKYFGGLMLNRLAGMKGVTVERAQCLRVLAPEDRRVYLQIDGESAGQLPAEIRIVPDALTLLVPPEYAR